MTTELERKAFLSVLETYWAKKPGYSFGQLLKYAALLNGRGLEEMNDLEIVDAVDVFVREYPKLVGKRGGQ